MKFSSHYSPCLNLLPIFSGIMEYVSGKVCSSLYSCLLLNKHSLMISPFFSSNTIVQRTVVYKSWLGFISSVCIHVYTYICVLCIYIHTHTCMYSLGELGWVTIYAFHCSIKLIFYPNKCKNFKNMTYLEINKSRKETINTHFYSLMCLSISHIKYPSWTRYCLGSESTSANETNIICLILGTVLLTNDRLLKRSWECSL